jgi:hypothetical protein
LIQALSHERTRRPQRIRHAACLLATAQIACMGFSATCAAQAVQPREALEDAKLYFTAPLRWDQRAWLEFGGTLVVLGIAHQYDDDIREHFVSNSSDALSGKDSNSASDALPAAILVAGTWIFAGVLDDAGGYRELGSMLEATVLSAASTEILKYAVGRQRPNETADPDQWFSGGDSFPSLHATAAFAIGTVFAESGDDRYRWLRRIVGYGVAGATAYGRVEHNAHWTTDVLAGAALGLSTARFTMQRRDSTPSSSSAMLVPVDHGLMLTFLVPLH